MLDFLQTCLQGWFAINTFLEIGKQLFNVNSRLILDLRPLATCTQKLVGFFVISEKNWNWTNVSSFKIPFISLSRCALNYDASHCAMINWEIVGVILIFIYGPSYGR